MEVNCKDVLREVSNYIDGELSPELRAALDKHLSGCRHCAALLDSTRNVVVLIADERTFELPAGFGERLRLKLLAEFARG